MFKLLLKLAIYGMWESFRCELLYNFATFVEHTH